MLDNFLYLFSETGMRVRLQRWKGLRVQLDGREVLAEGQPDRREVLAMRRISFCLFG
jgi:hypothetical protein